jgi:predicted alpha/beta-fold hydrolase
MWVQKNAAKAWAAIPKWVKISAGSLAILFLLTFFVVGWLVSSKALKVAPQTMVYDQTILAIDGNDYTIGGGTYSITGMVGGIRPDGTMIGIFSAPTAVNPAAATSVRTLSDTPSPELRVGDKLSLQGNIWTSDPKQALGLAFQDVSYTSPVGDMKAWLVPGSSAKEWVIGVHGIGADKTEMLRFIQPVHETGNTMLVINYRNDTNNPQSPDSYNHLGDTEWQDVEAAVQYAKEQGATDVRLYGDSLGGSLVQNYLQRSTADRSIVSRVILDSPALDWNEVLRRQLQKGGYPSFLYYPGTIVLRLRAGINVQNLSTQSNEITKKTLIIHSVDDSTVPQNASKLLAAARPDLVTLVDFEKGGHLRSWNYNAEKYEQLVINFLSQ